MHTIKENYLELIALTRQFLLRENNIKDKIITDSETYHFYRDRAKTQNSADKPLPTQEIKASVKNNFSPEPIKIPVPAEHLQNKTKFQPSAQVEVITKKEIKPPLTFPPPQTPLSLKIPEIATQPSKPTKNLAQEEIKNKKPSSFSSFTLEPMIPPVPSSLENQELKNLIRLIHPKQSICESTPPDHHAKKVKNAWQAHLIIPEVIILSFNQEDKHLTFLNNLAHAINRHLGSAHVISGPKWEQENAWDELLNSSTLRLVIASDYGLYLLPNLMKNYKEIAKNAKHFLNHIPLFLLSDISLYLREPQLKPLLWGAICTEYQTASKR